MTLVSNEWSPFLCLCSSEKGFLCRQSPTLTPQTTTTSSSASPEDPRLESEAKVACPWVCLQSDPDIDPSTGRAPLDEIMLVWGLYEYRNRWLWNYWHFMMWEKIYKLRATLSYKYRLSSYAIRPRGQAEHRGWQVGDWGGLPSHCVWDPTLPARYPGFWVQCSHSHIHLLGRGQSVVTGEKRYRNWSRSLPPSSPHLVP